MGKLQENVSTCPNDQVSAHKQVKGVKKLSDDLHFRCDDIDIVEL